jgi:hypothetical protein
MFNSFGNTIMGVQIVEDPNMREVVGEDWSNVRSPGRARRRRRKHRQNILPLYAPLKQFYHVGNRIICHPAVAAQLRAAVPDRRAA